MATKAKAAQQAQTVATPDTSAIVAAVMAALGAVPAPAATAKAAPAKAVPAVASNKAQQAIDEALASIGAKVTRFGATEARTTAKMYGRWVDCKIGAVRFQGNIYVSKA